MIICSELYGKVIVPELKTAPGSERLNSSCIAIGAGANADVTGKTEMHPAKQPEDMRISAEFSWLTIPAKGDRMLSPSFSIQTPNQTDREIGLTVAA